MRTGPGDDATWVAEAQVLSHLPGGLTLVSVPWPGHRAPIEIDVPTGSIPANARVVGRCFCLVLGRGGLRGVDLDDPISRNREVP